MERTAVFELMGELKLYGMRLAYDEVMATGIKRQHEPPQIVGDLLKAEIAESEGQARHRSEGRPERKVHQVSVDHCQAATGQGHR
jgi:hypothetical protein